jgi:phosphoribosylformylglycinamidine synthase
MRPVPGKTPFLADDEPIAMPAAHGEGKFLLADDTALDRLDSSGQVALRYIDDSGRPTQTYPANPSGTARAIAGLTDPTGRIFGLMPHPERNVLPWHDPRWTRRERPASEGPGLRLFRNATQTFR